MNGASEVTEHRARYVTEQWFRAQGLPYFVDRSNRGRRLLVRSAPVLVFLAIFSASLILLLRIFTLEVQTLLDGELDAEGVAAGGEDFLPLVISLVVLGFLFVLLLVIPGLAAVLARRYVRTRPAWARLVASVSIFLLVAVVPLLSIGVEGVNWYEDTLISIVLVLAVIALTWLGLGSFLGWSVRAAVKQLSAIWLLASIALPLLILVVIFAFYSVETWQMASRLARGQMFWLLAFLALVGTMFVVHSARKEAVTMPQELTEETRRKLREGTPLAGLKDSIEAEEEAEQEPAENHWSDLSPLERANVVIVLVLAQGIQVLFFGALAFVFMMVLCTLSIPPDLAQSWSGKPNSPSQFFGINFNAFPEAEVRVSAFLAGIAALNFAVSVNSSQAYRDAFYDPLILQTSKALAVHLAYKAHFVAPELLVAQAAARAKARAAAEEEVEREAPPEASVQQGQEQEQEQGQGRDQESRRKAPGQRSRRGDHGGAS
ncbi:hypothetical protein ODZ83_02450 [Acaricomes phytoseiuli]|uniref:hypothetical protein n=1 Tax=Acaricomes phytoseiuli TaxID=291968 RepID=UPI0022234E67|nr:hypothetical protein [Acaricomes phytoseiuli]MCW1249061.1 hypothetical protein [Acaricomes phytoseiuli]